MNEDRLRELISIYQKDSSDPEVLKEITAICMPLMVDTATAIWFSGRWLHMQSTSSIDDLVAEGFMGLLEVLKSFDLDAKVRFSTFAPWRIRGAMIDSLRRLDFTPRLTRVSVTKYSKVQRISGKRIPTLKDIQEILDVDKKRARLIRRETLFAKNLSSTEDIVFDDNYKSRTLGDLLESHGEDAKPARSLLENDEFEELLIGCDELERAVITFYYKHNMKMKAIGELLDLSESRISQVHDTCIRRLKTNLQGKEERSPSHANANAI